jgi:hypothetical protein
MATPVNFRFKGRCPACGCDTVSDPFSIFPICPCCAVDSKSCPQLYPNNPPPRNSPPPRPVDKIKAVADATAIFEANRDRWVEALRNGLPDKRDPKEGWDGGLLAKLLYVPGED